MVLGVFVSGIIDLNDGHGCVQKKMMNQTMVMEFIYISWGRFWNEAAFFAADKNQQVKLKFWKDRDEAVSFSHWTIQMHCARFSIFWSLTLFYILFHVCIIITKTTKRPSGGHLST